MEGLGLFNIAGSGWADRDLAYTRKGATGVGVRTLAPQDLGVYATLTVRRNLEFFGEINGLSGDELKRRVEEAARGEERRNALGLRRSGEVDSGQLLGHRVLRRESAGVSTESGPISPR